MSATWHGWAAQLPAENLAEARALRLDAIDCLVVERTAWLRSSRALDEHLKELLRLPLLGCYRVGPDELLFPHDGAVPTSKLPAGNWRPLAALLEPATPALKFPALLGDTIPLRLERRGLPQDANMLLCSIEAWSNFALRAPAIRLQGLQFAQCETAVLIWGRPLPAIPGTACVESSGIAIPCGLDFAPISDRVVIRRLLRMNADDVALFATDGSFELIARDQFVGAARAAVRLSQEVSQ